MIVSDCPYGVPGDRLWVRETFAIECDREYVHDPEFAMPRDGRPFQTHDGGDEYGEYHIFPRYRATEPDTILEINEEADEPEDMMRWTPSIHMPRWASRITLEIADVRVQRLQEIDYLDAYAEGIPEQGGNSSDGAWRVTDAFHTLWDSINAKRGFGWDANPWVWALTFRRLA